MGFFDTLKSMQEGALKQYKLFANDNLRIGTMYAYAMVTQANGELKPEELEIVNKLIQRDDDLKVYGADKCLADFRAALESYNLSPMIGEMECLGKLEKVKTKLDTAQRKMLLAKVCAIGAADGDFDKNERAVARKICVALELSPSAFGL